MSEDNAQLKRMVDMAAGIVVGSQNEVGIARAMEICGFNVEQRRNMTLYQRVRRRTSKLCIVEKKKLAPNAVDLEEEAANTAISSLTSGTPQGESNNCSLEANSSSGNPESASTATGEDENTIAVSGSERTPIIPSPNPRRSLFEADKSNNTNGKVEEKKYRCSSKELQRLNAMKADIKERNKRAMKVATKLYSESQKLPKNNDKKKSAAKIVDETNGKFNSNFSVRTATRYVQDGYIGQSPLKRGPVGDLNKVQYDALKGAHATYLKLEQAASRKQSTCKQMSKIVNATEGSRRLEMI